MWQFFAFYGVVDISHRSKHDQQVAVYGVIIKPGARALDSADNNANYLKQNDNYIDAEGVFIKVF